MGQDGRLEREAEGKKEEGKQGGKEGGNAENTAESGFCGKNNLSVEPQIMSAGKDSSLLGSGRS